MKKIDICKKSWIWIRSKKHREESEKGKKRDLRKETIAVLVEEAEGLLELGDLFVGELIGHLGRGCLGSEKISAIQKRKWRKMSDESALRYVENERGDIMLFIYTLLRYNHAPKGHLLSLCLFVEFISLIFVF